MIQFAAGLSLIMWFVVGIFTFRFLVKDPHESDPKWVKLFMAIGFSGLVTAASAGIVPISQQLVLLSFGIGV